MKKNYVLLSLSILISMNCFSQKSNIPQNNNISQNNKGYVAFSLGPAFPIGDFRSTEAQNIYSGFATTGFMYDLSLGYKIGTNFGITAMARSRSNGIDDQAVTDVLNQPSTGISWQVESKNWWTGAFLFGGFGSFPVSPNSKTSFEARAMFGFVSASSAAFNVSTTYLGTTAVIDQRSVAATGIGFLLGAGFKFNTGANFCVFTNLDYFSTKPEFKNVETTSNFAPTQYTSFTQPMESINLSLGLGLRF